MLITMIFLLGQNSHILTTNRITVIQIITIRTLLINLLIESIENQMIFLDGIALKRDFSRIIMMKAVLYQRNNFK